MRGGHRTCGSSLEDVDLVRSASDERLMFNSYRVHLPIKENEVCLGNLGNQIR